MKKGILHFCTHLIFIEYEILIMTTGMHSCGVSNSASLSLSFQGLRWWWFRGIHPFKKWTNTQGSGMRKVPWPRVALGTVYLSFRVPSGWKRQAGAPAAEMAFHLCTEANVEIYLGWCPLRRSWKYSSIRIMHLSLFSYMPVRAKGANFPSNNSKTAIKPLPQLWVKDRKGTSIYFVSSLWQLGKTGS